MGTLANVIFVIFAVIGVGPSRAHVLIQICVLFASMVYLGLL